MAMTANVARPYSSAIFQVAQEDQQFQQWSELLQVLVLLTEDSELSIILDSPKVSTKELTDIVLDICEKGIELSDKGRNLVKLLMQYRRLSIISEIKDIYEYLRAEAEKTMDVEIVSAVAIGENIFEKLTVALSKKLDRKVSLSCEVDETLLGGAIIRAGDIVIDGSVTGQLKKLASEISR